MADAPEPGFVYIAVPVELIDKVEKDSEPWGVSDEVMEGTALFDLLELLKRGRDRERAELPTKFAFVRAIAGLANLSDAYDDETDPVILKTVNETEGNLIYLGVEDFIYDLAEKVLKLFDVPQCTYATCTEPATKVLSYPAATPTPCDNVAAYCDSHAEDLRITQGAVFAGGPALSPAVHSIEGIRR